MAYWAAVSSWQQGPPVTSMMMRRDRVSASFLGSMADLQQEIILNKDLLIQGT